MSERSDPCAPSRHRTEYCLEAMHPELAIIKYHSAISYAERRLKYGVKTTKCDNVMLFPPMSGLSPFQSSNFDPSLKL